MSITADQILRVRRMTNEPTQAPYTDALITSMAEDHKLTETGYPGADVDVYDLHAIAADIWEEKAAALAQDFDFSEQGAGSYSRSQAYEQAEKQAKFHLARRKPRSRKPVKFPKEVSYDNAVQ
jgi:hypothetical protein